MSNSVENKAFPEMKVVKEVKIPMVEANNKVDIIEPLLGNIPSLKFYILNYNVPIVSLVYNFQIMPISFWGRMEMSVSYPRNVNI